MGTFVGPNIVTDGLVFAVDAGSERSYPGTGSTWYDLSGNGLDMTMVGTLTWNSAGYFTGWHTANYFNCTEAYQSFLPIGNQARTIIAVVEVETVSGYQHVAHYGLNTTNQAYGLALQGGKVSDHRWGTSNIGTVVLGPSDGVVMLSTRHETNTGARFGIDTLFQDMDTITGANTNSNFQQFRIGSRINNGETWMNDGKIFRVLIYNRSLTDAEIEQNYNALKSRFGL
tara:strand:+ start:120 stop:803 length:684 start_codon:yes stop_codon:yes gene_type:complete